MVLYYTGLTLSSLGIPKAAAGDFGDFRYTLNPYAGGGLFCLYQMMQKS